MEEITYLMTTSPQTQGPLLRIDLLTPVDTTLLAHHQPEKCTLADPCSGKVPISWPLKTNALLNCFGPVCFPSPPPAPTCCFALLAWCPKIELHLPSSQPRVSRVALLIIVVSGYLRLEKAMAPHSSTLAYKIPWTEELGKLQSMGSLRVGHK